MHFPIGFSIGNNHVQLHAILETLAFFIGFRYFVYLRKQSHDSYTDQSRMWVIIGAIFGALFGSRILGSLERPGELVTTNNVWLYIYQNKTILGGLLGGLAGVELTKKLIGEKAASGDLFVFPIILSMIIGRTGCFSMGVFEETYGIPTTLPWGMNLGDGVRRHPVMLYEIAYLLLLWIVLKQVQKRWLLENGALFKLFMISYFLFRFFIDFIKPPYPVIFGLNTIQLACIAGLIYYNRYILKPKKLMAAYA